VPPQHAHSAESFQKLNKIQILLPSTEYLSGRLSQAKMVPSLKTIPTCLQEGAFKVTVTFVQLSIVPADFLQLQKEKTSNRIEIIFITISDNLKYQYAALVIFAFLKKTRCSLPINLH
jgi:hypothetical protein